MSMDKVSALESYSGPDCDVCGDDPVEFCSACQTLGPDEDYDAWPAWMEWDLDAAVSALTERVESLLR